MSYQGDLAPASVLDFSFTSSNGNGAPTTLAGTPSLAVYQTNSATQSTAGITLDVDFDGVTGLNHVRIDTSADGTFYAAGRDFDVVITAGTIGGNSAVGYVIGSFSLASRSALRPATAGRQAAIDASGRVDVGEWLGSAPNALQSGRVDSYLGAVATGVIAAASFASGALDAVWSTATRVLTAGTNIALAKGTGVTGFNDLDAAALRSAVGLGSANLDTQLGTITTDVAAVPTANANADALLDRANAIEAGWTPRQALRVIASVLAGKASGAAGPTIIFRDITDTKDRVTATVDASGDRTSVTADGT